MEGSLQKVENLAFYMHETGVLFVEGFAQKFLFFPFKHEVVQDIAFDGLAPDCSIQVLPFFLKFCLQSVRVFNCRGIVFLTNPTVCLKSVFRPKKNSFSWASSQVLHKLTTVAGKVLPFEAFFWHLLFGGSFPSFATISIASCSGS